MRPIFKEIMVNSTASPSFRHSFDVVIPHEASISGAIDAINRALGDQPGILRDPPPRTLVEALEPGGVRLRADFWSPTQSVDWFQLLSDVNLKAKVGLQLAGVIGPVATAGPVAEGLSPKAPVDDRNGPTIRFDQASTNSRHDVASQAAANLRRDARAASPRRRARGRPGDAHGARARTGRDSRQR